MGRPFKNLQGIRYGRLIVQKLLPRPAGVKNGFYWDCLCDCGNHCIRTTANLYKTTLINGVSGCDVCKRNLALEGKIFGRLTVIKKSQNIKIFPSGKKAVLWICKCNCGNTVEVNGWYLKNGDTKSCGCLDKEISANRGKQMWSKHNTFDFSGDFAKGFTENGSEFWFDKEDFEKIKDSYWFFDGNGYVINSLNQKLHRIVMNASDNDLVDHISHPPRLEHKIDNRKSNLRIVTQSQNSMNSSLRIDSTSGVKGVSYRHDKRKWVAYIGVNYKTIHLGAFDSKEDAIKARKKAEEEYFGEYNYKG